MGREDRSGDCGEQGGQDRVTYGRKYRTECYTWHRKDMTDDYILHTEDEDVRKEDFADGREIT